MFSGQRTLALRGHLDTRGERSHGQTGGTAVPEKQAPRSDASVMLMPFVNSVALFEGNLPPTPATILQRQGRRSSVTPTSLNKQTWPPITAFGGRRHQFLYI